VRLRVSRNVVSVALQARFLCRAPGWAIQMHNVLISIAFR
jgi:hypothetical protein